MSAFQIRDWAKHFESYESKRLQKMTWVRITNNWGGRGLRRVARHPRAHEIMGAWLMIVEVASKMPIRGLLIDDRGQILGPVELADMTGMPEDGFRLAMTVLADPVIAWIEPRESRGGHTHLALGGKGLNRPAENTTSPADPDSSPAEKALAPADSDPFCGEIAISAVETDRQREKAGSQALGLDWRKHRPTDLPRSLAQTWEQIAKAHGGPIANSALQVARRLYGATVNHGQLSATYQAAHRDGSLELPVALWPDPRAKAEKPAKANGDTFPTANHTLAELVEQGLICDDSADGIE